jgi:capsular polysaccharide biosynthesis protein
MITNRDPSGNLVRSAETIEDEKVISLSDILYVISKYIWLILITMVLASTITLAYTLRQPPQYQASVKILIGQDSGFIGDSGNVQQLEDLTQTMAQAIRTRPVAEGVIRRQGLNLTPEALLDQLTADQVPNTQFIQVHYRDTDPRIAQAVADTIGVEFSELVTEVSPDVSAVTATVWEQAAVPGQPMGPSYGRNIAGALIVGAMLGLGLAFLLHYLDDNKKKGEG